MTMGVENTSEMKIVYKKVSELHRWDKNPKLHDDRAIEDSIDKFGIRQPIIVQKGTNRIIAGHGRYNAYIKKGMLEVPVIEWECSSKEAEAYAIADNRTTILGGWNEEQLTDILKDMDTDLLPFTGYSVGDLEKLILKLEPNEPEFDENIETTNRCPKCGYEW